MELTNKNIIQYYETGMHVHDDVEQQSTTDKMIKTPRVTEELKRDEKEKRRRILNFVIFLLRLIYSLVFLPVSWPLHIFLSFHLSLSLSFQFPFFFAYFISFSLPFFPLRWHEHGKRQCWREHKKEEEEVTTTKEIIVMYITYDNVKGKMSNQVVNNQQWRRPLLRWKPCVRWWWRWQRQEENIKSLYDRIKVHHHHPRHRHSDIIVCVTKNEMISPRPFPLPSRFRLWVILHYIYIP